jgi:hypothetical protein
VRGILFDRPAAIRSAESLLRTAGLGDRCELVTGDFFESIPGGGDAYLLSRVIHDWSTEEAERILKSVRRAMRDDATLLIIERVLDAAQPSVEAALADVHMMVMNGGRERSSARRRRLERSASDSDRLVGAHHRSGAGAARRLKRQASNHRPRWRPERDRRRGAGRHRQGNLHAARRSAKPQGPPFRGVPDRPRQGA